MNKFRRFMKSKTGTYLLFGAAAVLLIFSSVGGARAALIYSQTYSSQVEMFDIGVALLENGDVVSQRDYNGDARNGSWNEETGELLAHMLDGKGEQLKLGAAYPEALSVRNNGTINEYVRVTVYKYWTRDGEKDYTLSPEMIDLHFLTGNGWEIDEGSSTDERTVLYYSPLLEVGKDSAPFSDTLTIDGEVADIVKTGTKTSADGSTVTTYAYDGAKFVVEARVDAVQEHNAGDAIWSAWGRRVDTGDHSVYLAE